jgi:hypothetical protein
MPWQHASQRRLRLSSGFRFIAHPASMPQTANLPPVSLQICQAGDCKSADALAADLPLMVNLQQVCAAPRPRAQDKRRSGEPTSQSRQGLLLTSLHTSISAKGPPTMTTHKPVTTAESVTYKRFCSPAAIHGQSQLEISGFGVRVPGGAQKPRSRKCPGLRHVVSALFRHSFAECPLRAHPSGSVSRPTREQLGRASGIHLTVTMRHITSVRIVAAAPDPAARPTLSSQPKHRLEA